MEAILGRTHRAYGRLVLSNGQLETVDDEQQFGGGGGGALRPFQPHKSFTAANTVARKP